METASETLSLWHSGSKNDPRYRVNETLTSDASSASPRIAGLKFQRSRRANLRRKVGSRIAGLRRSSTRPFRGSLPNCKPRPKRQEPFSPLQLDCRQEPRRLPELRCLLEGIGQLEERRLTPRPAEEKQADRQAEDKAGRDGDAGVTSHRCRCGRFAAPVVANHQV